MADNKEVLGLDLDVTDFKEGISAAKEGLSSLTEGTNLGKLGELISAGAAGLTAVGVAALALKVTFDEVFEGDKIKRTNALFENLAQSFGLAGRELEEGIVKSAKGMADTTEILNAANRSMIGLGQNATMLPQIMEVARKATQAFGGDLTERFESISRAITSGNVRMLKANGIFIDGQKAMRDYAVSIGAAVSELNESGRQQAVFNAVMEYSHKNMAALKGSVDDSTKAWSKFKIEVKEAADVIALAFNKIFGPTVRSMISGFSGLLHDVSNQLKSTFGEGAEKAAADIEILEAKIKSTKVLIAQMQNGPAAILNKAAIEAETKSLEALEKELRKQNALNDEISRKKSSQAVQAAAQNEKLGKSEKERNIDAIKAAENRIKLADEILKIQEKDAAESIKLAKSEAGLKVSQIERVKLAEQRAALEIQKINQQVARGELAAGKLAEQKKKAIEQDLHMQKMKFMKEEKAEHKAMLQNELDDSKSFWDGFANAAKVSTSQAKEDMKDFGKQGKATFDTIKSHSVSAFEEMGKAVVDSSKSASEIMRDMFLGALADIAIQKGEVLLAESVYPPNPIGLAAGAGLIALGGAIKAMAGGGASSSGTASAGGGGGGGSYGGVSSAADAAATPQQVQGPAAGSLTVNIQGDYLNTQETQRTLLQAVRDATDQTGFQYLQIGQTGAQSF